MGMYNGFLSQLTISPPLENLNYKTVYELIDEGKVNIDE